MTGVLLGVSALLDGALLTLVVGGVLGGAAYVGTLWIVARDTVIYLLDTARPGRRKVPAGGGTPA
jgi:hypothetical protein